MLKSIISASGITSKEFFILLVISLVCGLLIYITCSLLKENTRGFLISLLVIPVIVQVLLTLVNSNIGTGIAIAGAFSLIRFRSVPGKAKDIIYVFLSMTVGLATAAGYVYVALLLTIIVCAIILILSKININKTEYQELRITIPENMNYQNAFDDLFKKYTNSFKLLKVKTSNMGSLYKLEYKISLKNKDNTKEFIDNLRCRNGNFEILITDFIEGVNEL